MGVMRHGGGTGPVPYLKGQADTDGNPIVYDALYAYTFNRDLSGKFLSTTYRRLSIQENEYYAIKWAQYSPVVSTEAGQIWDDLNWELRL